jgi:hypothetical protein
LPDFSGHANSATLHGASSGTAGYGFGAGKVNSALLLNAAGKGYVDLPAGILAGACETTIAAWVYLNSQSDWQRIWDFGVAPSAGVDPSRYMFLTGSNSVSKVIRFAITIQGTAGEELVEGETAVPAGEWHHVVVVLGPAGAVLYLNGVQVGSNSNLTLRPADLGNTPNNYIGRSQYPKDPYLDGKVDEFRVYDRALSADEVAALYGYGW